MQLIVNASDASGKMFLKANMLEIGEGADRGGVDTCTGLGSDAIILYWKDKQAVVQGRDLLRAWIETFDPKTAKRIPK